MSRAISSAKKLHTLRERGPKETIKASLIKALRTHGRMEKRKRTVEQKPFNLL